MHRTQSMQTGHQTQKTGFTLIELLVVISIIALLSALLLGGIQAARLAVANAKAGNELNSLSTALAQFHSEFGMYPPSSIVLYEAKFDPNNSQPDWSDDIRSQALIRKLWPDFNFGLDRDLNGNSNTTDTLVLDGRECLVFFIGGMMKGGGAIGFSKNPSNPFSVSGNNRTGPFHEFFAKRFVDTDGDGLPEYLDTYSGQTTPILYLSSYGGRGYRNADLPSGMIDCYRKAFSMDVDNRSNIATAKWIAGSVAHPDKYSSPAAWKGKGFQLISPGREGEYGLGGYYADGMQKPPQPEWIPEVNDWDQIWSRFLREREFLREQESDQDNITNFSSGKLK